MCPILPLDAVKVEPFWDMGTLGPFQVSRSGSQNSQGLKQWNI